MPREPARRPRHPRRLGLAPPGPGNAVDLARHARLRPPLAEYPHTTLDASGEAVGLPRRPDGELRGRAPDDRQRAHPLPGSPARRTVRSTTAPSSRTRRCSAPSTRGGQRAPARARLPRRRPLAHRPPAGAARAWGSAPERTCIHAFTDGRDVSPHGGRATSRSCRPSGSPPSAAATGRWTATTLGADGPRASPRSSRARASTPAIRSRRCARATSAASPTSSSSRS